MIAVWSNPGAQSRAGRRYVRESLRDLVVLVDNSAADSDFNLAHRRNYALGMPGSDSGGGVTGRFSRFYPKDSLAPEANR